MTDRPRTRPAVLLTLAGLVVLGAATATAWQFEPPGPLLEIGLGQPPEIEQPSLQPPTTPPEPTTQEPSDTITTVLLALAAIVVLLLLWAAARKILAALRATPPETIDPDALETGTELASTSTATVPLPELADAVSRALAHLDSAENTTDAVVAAWVALEDAAAEHGTTRDPAQTPTEFTQTVLSTTPAPPADVATLRRLYQRARFTDHPTTDTDVATARDALVRIASQLEVHTE